MHRSLGSIISIHPPREGWDRKIFSSRIISTMISIHPPREGWDVGGWFTAPNRFEFQSTHPVRGGTVDTGRVRAGNDISIHPPREGWDH